VAPEPGMHLPVSKLIQPYRLAQCSSNKAVSLSLNRHGSGSLTDRFQVCHANGWGLASQLGSLHFHNSHSDCLHI